MRVFVGVLATLVLAAVALTACKSIDRERSALSTGTANSNPQASKYPDGVNRVTPSELSDALARGDAVVVDVRGQSQYDAGHVKGATLIPAAEIAGRMGELPQDKMIVTYCS